MLLMPGCKVTSFNWSVTSENSSFFLAMASILANYDFKSSKTDRKIKSLAKKLEFPSNKASELQYNVLYRESAKLN